MRIGSAYLVAKAQVIDAGYWHEITNYGDECRPLDEERILSEAAWAVVSVGLAWRTVRSIHQRLSPVFFHWKSAALVASLPTGRRAKAIKQFNHPGKIDAIITFAKALNEEGADRVAAEILSGSLAWLVGRPYFGLASSAHLAKNLGANIPKPDRHLRRLAQAASFRVEELCDGISEFSGDDIRTVDSVVWRFATINRAYVEHFLGPASR
jgi:hypothetical protein